MLTMFKNIINKGIATEKKACSKEFLNDCINIPFIKFDEKKCAACASKICASVCPTSAITINQKKTVGVAPIKCIQCRMCEDHCPAGAISFANFGTGATEFNILSEKLKKEIKNNFSRSFHIRQLDAGSCNACDHEMISICNPVFDISRFGIDFVASPRHADCLMVTGPVSWNLKESLIRTIEATPDPKVIIALGTCAASGEPFGENYASYGGVNKVTPADILIPGCPPHPYAIIEGLLRAVKIITEK